MSNMRQDFQFLMEKFPPDIARKIPAAIRNVEKTPDGQLLMALLRAYCHLEEGPNVPGSQDQTFVRIGHQEVALLINRIGNIPQDIFPQDSEVKTDARDE